MSVEDLPRFLRARRAGLRPEAVGLPVSHRRRVPGLRREELAQLAGVSVAYYTRLEQGESRNASPGVLDALARALRLDADGCAHLYTLARAPQPRRDAPQEPASEVTPGVRAMLAALDEVPACVVGPRMELLAWTPFGHALLAGHLERDAVDDLVRRPNMAWLVFLDAHTQELFVDLDAKAQEAVAYLRRAAGRRPGDQALATLIGTLAVRSEHFAELWAQAPVRDKTSGVRRFAHPLVGPLELDFQALVVPGSDDHLVVTFTAAPGSPSAAGLRLLAAESPRRDDEPAEHVFSAGNNGRP